MNIKKRVTLSIVVFCSILIIVMSIIIYEDSSALLSDQKKELMNIQLDRVSENINHLIQLNEKETEKLAANKTIEKFLNGEITTEESNQYLKALMQSKNNEELYKDFFILNLQGFITTTTMESAENLDLSMRDYFHRARDNKVTVNSNILVARSDQELIIITLTPIVYDNEVKGYAGIAIKANYFSKFLSNMKISDSGYYIILDQNGMIVSHPNEDNIAKNYDTLTIDNNENIIINQTMDETNYELIAIANRSEINEEQNILLSNGYLIGFIGIFLSILLGIILSDKITKPIVEVNEYIERVIKRSSIFKENIHQQKELFADDTKMNRLKKNTSFVLSEIENNNLIKYARDIETTYENTFKFISKLSHDLRTPLTLIKGYSKGLNIEQGTKNEKYLDKIDKSIKDIENIIFNELDIAYELNKDVHLNRQEVKLEEYIEELIDEIKEISNQKSREINILRDTMDGKALLDRSNFKRVIENILNNAIKYSENKIDVEFKEMNDKILIKIADEGIGISKDELDKIRDIFYQTTDEKDGYGLGLHIADNIINKHNYVMEISSEENVGTEVKIYIDKIKQI